MYRIRNLLVILLAFSFFLPLTSAEDNTYRVEGLPDDLHFETGKAYTVTLTASNYSAIANVNISVTNGSLSETEDFGELHNESLLLNGRADNAIISGGENIDSSEIANAILQIIPCCKVVPFKEDDSYWGEISGIHIYTNQKRMIRVT